MADRNKFEQLLEYIVNNEQEKAEELFHSLVVEKSREIYEGLFEDEIADVDLDEAKDKDDEDEDKMDEASKKEDDDEEDKMDESVDEVEETFDSIEEIGGDAADDMMKDVEMGSDDDAGDEGSEEGEGDIEDRVMDLEDALDDLKAEFEKLMGDEEGDMDMGDMGMDDEAGEEEKEEAFIPAFEEEIEEIDLTPAAQMREYVEKIGDAYKGGKVASSSEASGANTKSPVAGKNDMGGTTANIAKGGTGSEKGTAGGLLNPSTKEDNAGNVNVPGAKSATKLSSVAKGHGAEKKGAGEDAQNKKSIIGSK
jgi:hypothetical protein